MIASGTMEVEQPAAAQIRSRGLRATASRVAIFDAVVGLGDHPDAKSVLHRVRAQTGAVSMQAVYDGLQVLTEAGMLRRIEPAGSPARFEPRVGDNHHHAICRVCGVTRDVDCAVGATPCLQPDDASGFEIDEAEVIYWGLCPDCSEAATERKT